MEPFRECMLNSIFETLHSYFNFYAINIVNEHQYEICKT